MQKNSLCKINESRLQSGFAAPELRQQQGVILDREQNHTAILLRKSYREDGKMRKRTLANLSCLPAEVIEGLKVLLRGGVAMPSAQEGAVSENGK